MESNIYHVLPINDTQEHEESNLCKCNPKCVVENGILIVTHNSFDGREAVEWANEIIK